MAKLKSNLIEQHIEKIVLGVCFLLLVYVLIGWVLDSPRTFEAPDATGRTQPVPPDQVDQKIEQAAQTIFKKWQDAKASEIEPDRSLQEIAELQIVVPLRDLEYLTTHAAPGVPDPTPQPIVIDKPDVAAFYAKLPGPAKPKVNLQRELPLLEPLNDAVVAHVIGTFPYGDWDSGWKTALRSSIVRPSFYILAVRAEVREKTPQGWISPPRPIKASAAPLTAQDNSLIRIPEDLPKLPDYDERNPKVFEEALEAMVGWERYILQPDFYDIWWPGHGWVSWQHNRPHLSVPEFDEGAETAPEGAAPRVPAAPAAPAVPRVVPRAAPRAPMMEPPMYDPIMRPMPSTPRGAAPTPRPAGSSGAAPRPAGGARVPMQDTPTPRAPTAAGRGMDPYRGMMPPVGPDMMPRPPAAARKTAPVAPAAPRPGQPVEEVSPLPEVQVFPSLDMQKRLGQVVVYFHDASLKSRTTYQFRFQLEVYNPLYMWTNELKKEDADFAKKKTLLTPFSEWSDPVSVVQPIEFFMTGSNETENRVKVAVFAHHLGQYIKQDFNLSEGRPIGELRKVELNNPAKGSKEKREVDFTSGAVAIEFRFNVPYVRKNLAQQTVQMVYLDQDGQIKTRLLAIDRDSPRKKQLDALVTATAAREEKPAGGAVTPPAGGDRGKKTPPRVPMEGSGIPPMGPGGSGRPGGT